MQKTSHNDHDLAFLAEVAHLYYEQGWKQVDIGRKLKTSRSTISRALQEAKDKGIVEITIHYALAERSRLEQRLKQSFNLKDIKVLQSDSSDSINELGKLAADYLANHVENDMILGVSYGRSIAATIKNTLPQDKNGITVVQIIGALGSTNPLIDGPDLSRELANKYAGSYRYLYAPLLVEDVRTRNLLVEEPLVQDVLGIGKLSDIALLGIGALGENSSSLWTGYLNEKELSWLRSNGAAGHMCAEFYDAEGKIMAIPYNDRSISIGLNALNDIKTVVAVAGSKEKSHAILGALKGGYIDVLITDKDAAEGVLELLNE